MEKENHPDNVKDFINNVPEKYGVETIECVIFEFYLCKDKKIIDKIIEQIIYDPNAIKEQIDKKNEKTIDALTRIKNSIKYYINYFSNAIQKVQKEFSDEIINISFDSETDMETPLLKYLIDHEQYLNDMLGYSKFIFNYLRQQKIKWKN